MIDYPLYYLYNPPRETFLLDEKIWYIIHCIIPISFRETFLLDKKIWLIITCGNKNILEGQRTRIPIFVFYISKCISCMYIPITKRYNKPKMLPFFGLRFNWFCHLVFRKVAFEIKENIIICLFLLLLYTLFYILK